METRDCPHGRRHSLFQTWACRVCSYAITQAALLIDQADARSGTGAGRPTAGPETTRACNEHAFRGLR